MFLVISQRLDFVRNWTATLRPRGEVETFSRTEDWDSCLDGRVPHLVVLDYELLGLDPAPQLKLWRSQCATAHLVLAGTEFPPTRELAALAAGVLACCDARLSGDERERIVDVVLQGGVWISPATLPHFVSRLQAFSARQDARASDAAGASSEGALASLTERQREVALLVGQGASNKKIGSQMNITDRTVKAHLTMIFEKLGVTDRLQLALYMTRHSG